MTSAEIIRRIVRLLLLGLLVIVTAFVVAFWLQQDQVAEVQRLAVRADSLAASNRVLIDQVDQLNRTQADAAYQECVARNARARESVKAFTALVAAHRRDGNPRVAAIWQGYLEQTQKLPIPPCKKPERA